MSVDNHECAWYCVIYMYMYIVLHDVHACTRMTWFLTRCLIWSVFNCRQLAAKDSAKLQARLRPRGLADVTPNTVLEALSFKKTETQVGPVFLIDVIETVTNDEGRTRRMTSKLMIPERFEGEVSKIPCVLYYIGKKPIKGGKQCHDLRFISHDDADVLHDGDDDESDNEVVEKSTKRKPANVINSDESDVDTAQKPKRKRRAEPSKATPVEISPNSAGDLAVPCNQCRVDGLICYGYCAICSCHQPYDGSQCRCMI